VHAHRAKAGAGSWTAKSPVVVEEVVPMPVQPRLIVGTAGHVDHGKTALLRRLTGINTDRWREEQERGLTIDLGFAYLDLPSGDRLAFIDVPGHERFLHNMLAGVSGIDVVLLTVAADEGVMPQTREHVAILDLLEVSEGIVVITKADRADDELIQLVRSEVEELLAPTSLAGSPFVITSAQTGQGLAELVELLDKVARRPSGHDVDGPTRMPLDRSFTLAGHGTVVTGSLLRGRLVEGQRVEILPRGLVSRVRRLEAHGETVAQIEAPARVGVNLADVASEEVRRGDQLVEPGSMRPTWLLDVELRLIADAAAPLKQRSYVRLHLGTAEMNARVVLLDGREALLPGDTTFAQLALDRQVAAAVGDHYVVRGGSPLTTIGGGVVLDPHPRHHRPRRPEVLAALEAAKAGSQADRAVAVVARHRLAGVGEDDLRRELQVTAEALRGTMSALESEGRVEQIAGRWVAADVSAEAREKIREALQTYHQQRPLRAGRPLRELQTTVGVEAPVLQRLLAPMVEAGEIEVEGGLVRLAGHKPRPHEDHQKLVEQVLEQVKAAGLQAPTREEVLEKLGGGEEAHDLLSYLVGQGDVVQVGNFVFARQSVEKAETVLREKLSAKAFTAAEARDALGSTRKYVVPLLEYFDRAGLTIRRGDERRIRQEN